jgi:hypothetical protein
LGITGCWLHWILGSAKIYAKTKAKKSSTAGGLNGYCGLPRTGWHAWHRPIRPLGNCDPITRRFEVANDEFNGVAALQCALESPGVDAAYLPGLVKGDFGHVNAPVTQIDKHFLGTGAAENLRLFQARLECVAIWGCRENCVRPARSYSGW